ncbi:MAG TPA: YihY/virulence factor BrkB family protein [Blastocatellia bacterium]|nr:YihY/virulence factor BrkB family protein [Blastocatellia bacterium]
MKDYFLGGLTLREWASELYDNINEDRILGRAAELGYYFMFALFPMLIFLTSLVGFLPEVRETIFKSLARVVPGEAMTLVHQTIMDVTRNRNGGLVSFGVLGALWAASGGVTAVMDTLNIAYKVEEARSFWKVRLIAIGLTILLSVLIVGGTVLIMFGDRFSVWLAQELELGAGFAIFWSVVDYLLALALLFLGLQLIYYFGPNVKQEWRWISPGSVFAVVSLIVASLLLSLYLRVAPDYSATYGSLGAVVVLMLWLYLAGIVVLIGGEINSIRTRAIGEPVKLKEIPEAQTI